MEKLVSDTGPPLFRQDALALGGNDDRVGLRDGPRAHVAGQPSRRGRDEVDLVVRAVQAEADGAFGLAAVDVLASTASG